MTKKKDKSRGKGCITCEVVPGKTCEGCTHRDDIVKEAIEQTKQ